VLELDAPIVGYQGALIRDMPLAGSARLGKLLVHTPLPAETAREVVAWSRSVGLDPHLNHLERFIVRVDDPRTDDYSAFMGWDADVADDLMASIRHGVSKVMAAGEPPLPTDVLAAARARFAGRADVTVSHPRFLEFLAPGVSKGRAVRWLARRHRIPLGAVLAIGDQWNDFEMLAEAGHGAAMPTAPTEVRAAARYLAPPLEEEGVGQLIEGLVLARPAAARALSRRLAAAADASRDPATGGAARGVGLVAGEPVGATRG
jgi:hydroxymethylpyrimidine pyrophosphatase-like HAD family hydrolase